MDNEIEMERVKQKVVQSIWIPSTTRIRQIFEEKGSVEAEDYSDFIEIDADLKSLKKFLKPHITKWLKLPAFISTDCTLCVVCGQSKEHLYSQYFQLGVGHMIDYHPKRWVDWGYHMNGTLCPYHAQLEALRQALESRKKQLKEQDRAITKGEIKKGFLVTQVEYDRPKQKILPLDLKYAPVFAEMKADGFHIHSYPNPETKQFDLTLIIADRRKMVNRGSIRYNEKVTSKIEKEAQ